MGCFMAPPLLCHRLLPFLLFCVFFFLVQIHWEVGNRENRSDHGSQNRVVRPRFSRVPVFSHRTVLKAKRTAKINGSRFFQSDHTVRSGPDFKTLIIGSFSGPRSIVRFPISQPIWFGMVLQSFF